MKNSELQLYLDAVIIQAAFSDHFVKNAEGSKVSELISAVKNYVGSKIYPNDKVGSVLNILAPGAISVMLGSLGLGWLRFLPGLAMNLFKVDTASILSGIYSEIKSLISGGKQTTSNDVDHVVKGAFDSVPAATKEDAEKFMANAFSVQLREAQLFKIALQDAKLKKDAGAVDFVTSFIFGKSKTVKLLSAAISWIIKAVLAAAGLMVASDGINALMGKSNDLTGNKTEVAVAPTKSTQTVFAPNSAGSTIMNSPSKMWIESGSPTQSNIKSFLLDWTEEVYPDTKDLTTQILNSPAFQEVVDTIEDYNTANKSGNTTFIPKAFSTKKDAVDVFIDDVAKANKSNGPIKGENA